MTVSIADIKKKQSFLDKIKSKIESNATQGGGSRDERFWQPTFDKETGGSAVIRFLPYSDLNEVPFVEFITHYFKGPTGQNYSERSLVSIGEKDVVSQLNSRLWNTGQESDKDQARAQKRKKKYIANILVVKDPANPDNNGKVFLYEFGPAIWNKMEGVMFPSVAGEEPIDVFNPFEGANFSIKIKPQTLGKSIVPNYNDSHFGEPSEVKGNIDELINKTYSLKEFISPDKFKSYNELAARLIEVLGYTTGSGIPTVEGFESPDNVLPTKQKSSSKSVEKLTESTDDDLPFGEVDDDDDELAKLKAMLGDDE